MARRHRVLVGLFEAAAYCGVSTKWLESFVRCDCGQSYVEWQDPDGNCFFEANKIRECVERMMCRPSNDPPAIVVSTANRDDRPDEPTLPKDTPLAIRDFSGIGFVPITANCSGIYFLFKGQECVYVGQSQNVLFRLATHVIEDKDFDRNRAFYFPCPKVHLDTAEGFFIDRLKPVLNKSYPIGGLELARKLGEDFIRRLPEIEMRGDGWLDLR